MPLGGSVSGAPVLAKHSDGRLEVFALGLNGHMFRKPQKGPNLAFVLDWIEMPANFQVFLHTEEALFDHLSTRIASALHPNGSLFVFARNARGRILFAHTVSSPVSYSDWKSLSAMQDGHPQMGNPHATSAVTSTDTLNLCVRAKNGNVLVNSLSSIDDWGDPNDRHRWVNLGGIVGSEPVIQKRRIADGIQIDAFVRGLDGNIYWTGQTVSTSGSSTHGVPFGP